MAAERSALPLISHEIGELDVAQRQQVWSIEVMRVAQEPLLVVFLAVAIYSAIEVGEGVAVGSDGCCSLVLQNSSTVFK